MSSLPITILSIDDDKEIRFSLGALFSTQGWHAIGAGTMMEGLHLFEQQKPDLVVLDYHMPGISGLQGVQLLRAIDADVPVLVLTVEESQEVADRFLAAGASDFALKPIKAPDILARINLHLRLSQHMRKPQKEIAPVSSKGIVPVTLDCIVGFLEEQGDYVSLDEISQGTGLAYQTVSRYLQYLTTDKQVVVQSTYGRVGRPRQKYMLNS